MSSDEDDIFDYTPLQRSQVSVRAPRPSQRPSKLSMAFRNKPNINDEANFFEIPSTFNSTMVPKTEKKLPKTEKKLPKTEKKIPKTEKKTPVKKSRSVRKTPIKTPIKSRADRPEENCSQLDLAKWRFLFKSDEFKAEVKPQPVRRNSNTGGESSRDAFVSSQQKRKSVAEEGLPQNTKKKQEEVACVHCKFPFDTDREKSLHSFLCKSKDLSLLPRCPKGNRCWETTEYHFWHFDHSDKSTEAHVDTPYTSVKNEITCDVQNGDISNSTSDSGFACIAGPSTSRAAEPPESPDIIMLSDVEENNGDNCNSVPLFELERESPEAHNGNECENYEAQTGKESKNHEAQTDKESMNSPNSHVSTDLLFSPMEPDIELFEDDQSTICFEDPRNSLHSSPDMPENQERLNFPVNHIHNNNSGSETPDLLNNEAEADELPDLNLPNNEAEADELPDPDLLNNEAEADELPDPDLLNNEAEELPDPDFLNNEAEADELPDPDFLNNEAEELPDPDFLNNEAEVDELADPEGDALIASLVEDAVDHFAIPALEKVTKWRKDCEEALNRTPARTPAARNSPSPDVPKPPEAVVPPLCFHFHYHEASPAPSTSKESGQTSILTYFKPTNSKADSSSCGAKNTVPNQQTIKAWQGLMGRMQKKKLMSLPSVSQNSSSEVSMSARANQRGRGRPAAERKTCPFYKHIPDTSIVVDAFNYGSVDGVTAYFLSHFHYDHYIGLGKKFSHPIYCSEITAKLVNRRLGVPHAYLHPLPMWEAQQVCGVEVTLLDANHCPGAVMFLFKVRGGATHLHVGDFRAHPSMESYPALLCPIDTLFLDTTYCAPEHVFPTQEEMIEKCVSLAQDHHLRNNKTLFVVGSYTIGKERVFKAIASRLNCSIWVKNNKKQALNCISDKEILARLTNSQTSAKLHVLPMSEVKGEKLKNYVSQLKAFFSEIVGFCPTGWEFAGKSSGKGIDGIAYRHPFPDVYTYGIPYSEHSNFNELRRFVQFIKPKKIIPTVHNGNPASRKQMQQHFSKWLNT